MEGMACFYCLHVFGVLYFNGHVKDSLLLSLLLLASH